MRSNSNTPINKQASRVSYKSSRYYKPDKSLVFLKTTKYNINAFFTVM